MLAKDAELMDKRFRVIEFIARGSFGEIYSVQRRLDKLLYALKCERFVKDAHNPILLWEAKVMKKLKPKVDAIPNVIHVG